MNVISRVILLLAGRSSRMGSLTANCPKCLLEVAGTSILERALTSLAACGVAEAILVVGYRSDDIRQHVGHQHAGMEIKYVHNDDFATTNTAYSLWLAREHLNGACFLLEGDILFETEVLRKISAANSSDSSLWAAVPIGPGHDEGILLEPGVGGEVIAVEHIREGDQPRPELAYKCAGIQLLQAQAARSFAERLKSVIARSESMIFADLVLGEILRQHLFKICSLDGMLWAEVDSPEDLDRAESVFRTKHRSNVTPVS